MGVISLLAGVIYCADCGGSMRYQRDYRSRKRHTDGHFGGFQAYTCNRYMSGGKAACTSHYINCKVLTKLLLLDIHAKAMLGQNSPAVLKEKILAQNNAASLEQTRTLRTTLATLDKRLAVIRDYAQLEELDRPTLLRLVKRIEYQVDGETHRDIKIYYNFVGYVEL